MGLIIGLIKRLIRLVIYFIIFAAIIILIPNLPPYTSFSAIKVAPTQQGVGPLPPNGALNNAEQLYKDKLLGPEAFQFYNGEIYTSLATGEIVKVSPGGHVTFVTKIGQPCIGIVQEHICGRPLGFQIDEKTNSLYVADAYHGIWKIDLKTDKKQVLVSPHVSIEGRKPKLFNSLALAKNGDFYWTDSTSDFSLKDGAIGVFADPSGRLFYYNAAKNQSKVLADDLWFPNGIVISPDHQFVLVAETSRYRVMKYYIDGPKKGTSEVFAEGLPGTPDNIRTLPDGSGVLLALYIAFDDDHPLLMKSMSETPQLRKFFARIQRLIEIPFEYLNNLYPHILLEEITYYIGHFRSMSGLTPGMSGLVQIDWNGKIVASYFNTDGSLGHISDAIVYNGKLYTGNPHVQNFVGSVSAPPLLLNAFSGAKKVEKKEVPKESKSQQQPKPTPKIQEKPIVEGKKIQKPVDSAPSKPVGTPKPTPSAHEKNKPVVEVKPAPQVKPPSTPSPKQPEQKPQPAVKVEPAKQTPPPRQQAEAKPTPTPKPEPKVTSKPESKPTSESKVKSKPEVKTTPMPKAADTKPITEKPIAAKPSSTRKEAEKKKSETQQTQQQNVKREGSKDSPQVIPIKEEISSDTAKPNKETLKVIKKGGPAEIPNPNLV